MHERENVLRIFKEARRAVSERDSGKIKSLSNQTTNVASLTHDPDNIAAAVVIYSLSKIIEREDYKKVSGWNRFYKQYVSAIDDIIFALERQDDKKYRKNIKIIQEAIKKDSGKLKVYIEDVFRKAKINKASKIYEHGISMGKTASLLGVTLYELAGYIGEKDIQEMGQKKSTTKSRIKLAMEMFG